MKALRFLGFANIVVLILVTSSAGADPTPGSPLSPPVPSPPAEAENTRPKQVEVLVPTRFKAYRIPDTLVYAEDNETLKPIKLTVAPGKYLEFVMKVFVHPVREPRRAQPDMEGIGPFPWRSPTGNMGSISAKLSKLPRNKVWVAEVEVAAMETDPIEDKFTRPANGQFRFLWQANFRLIPKIRSVWPAEIRERMKPDNIVLPPHPAVPSP